MAYFDCIVGGSGKGNTLVVTCADELAGATITCTNGTKTYTKTCPSTLPYEVTFYGLMAGTWTVSATVSGNTYTTTVVVVDCAALLGGFNWRTWVDTAQYLDSSDYNSLDEVLADELAVRELCLEHACVDYLADIATANEDVETIINNDLFAKWVNNSDYSLDTLGANVAIKALMDTADKYGYGEWVITDNTTTPPTWGAKGNVPVMTANNAPYGTVSASGTISGSGPWKVFDGVRVYADRWAPGSTSGWVQYRFQNPIIVKKVGIVPLLEESVSKAKNCTLKGSNDGTNFVDIATFETIYTEDFDVSWQTFEIDNDTAYLYYRLAITNSTGNVYVVNLQFYGRELKVSVPTMTGNTTPYGEAFGSSYHPNNEYYKAFGSGSWTAAMDATNNYVGYKFINPVIVKKVVASFGVYLMPSCVFTIQGSNDGSTWDNLGTIASDSGASSKKSVDIDNDTAYSRYRLFCAHKIISNTDPTWKGNCNVSVNFYGIDYSEKEFEAGTTKKWLYDHGVELETIYTVSATKNADCITLTAVNAEARTLSAVDFSLYNLLRGKVGSHASGTAKLREWVTGAYSDWTSSNMPYANALDVSSVNGQHSAGALMSAAGTFDVTELWLE